MTKLYKIKVGIEEYPVSETDLPRIVQAMKSNDMVQLEYGLFRGNAILAVVRDLDREREEMFLMDHAPTPEQIEEAKKKREVDEQIEKQMAECPMCTEQKGWIFVKNGNQTVAKPCSCTVLRPKLS